LTNHGNSGVGLGDSVFHSLVAAHVPTALAAFLGEAAVDLPDKLITVVVAVLLAQALSGRNLSSRPWVTPNLLSGRRVEAAPPYTSSPDTIATLSPEPAPGILETSSICRTSTMGRRPVL
jgi:hypothetical protein